MNSFVINTAKNFSDETETFNPDIFLPIPQFLTTL